LNQEKTSFIEPEGLWDPSNQFIIIKRKVLKNGERYAGVLLHEIAHAISGTIYNELNNSAFNFELLTNISHEFIF